MLHKITTPNLCRLCGKEKSQGTDLFKDNVKGSVLISIINKYFAKEVSITICHGGPLPQPVIFKNSKI